MADATTMVGGSAQGTSAEMPQAAPGPTEGLFIVERPPAGQRRVLQAHEQLIIKLAFELNSVEVGCLGDDLVLRFEDGAEVVVAGFISLAESCATLHLLLADGSFCFAESFTQDLGELPPLPEPAAIAESAAEPQDGFDAAAAQVRQAQRQESAIPPFDLMGQLESALADFEADAQPPASQDAAEPVSEPRPVPEAAPQAQESGDPPADAIKAQPVAAEPRTQPKAVFAQPQDRQPSTPTEFSQ